MNQTHTCHWPDCVTPVAPKYWGCAPHWYTLPKELRDAIWKHYVPGQEIRKDPSPAYLEVAALVDTWCRAYIARLRETTTVDQAELFGK